MDSLFDPNGLSTIAKHLGCSIFPSKTVVEVDSIVVSSLFGQRVKKRKHRSHHMKMLSPACVVDNETRDNIFSVFEQGRQELLFGYPQAYLDAAKRMAGDMYHGSELLKSQGPESRAIIEWCIAAYTMVINPESSVKLSYIKMGATKTRGFAIQAVAAIKNGETIHELVGLTPKDSDGKAEHSEVSRIESSTTNNNAQRILFGPIRFLNHRCLVPNAEIVTVCDKSAFCVVALQDINPGEELLVDYGKGLFADEPGGCPCLTCKPEERGTKRKLDERDEATIQAEIDERRKARRKKTRERRRQNRRDKRTV